MELVLEKRAQKFLAKLGTKHNVQVRDRLLDLIEDPMPSDSKQLKRSQYRSVTVGEYRVVYRVSGEVIFVPLIGKRNDGDVYRRLEQLER